MWQFAARFFLGALKSCATCVHRRRRASQHDCGSRDDAPGSTKLPCKPSEALTQQDSPEAGPHKTFSPNKATLKAQPSSYNRPFPSTTIIISRKKTKRRLHPNGDINKKISLYRCPNVYVLSDLRWKLTVSFRGRFILLLVLVHGRSDARKWDERSREMFQLMYFPVGRKTHVVAFNLMHVTLRTRCPRWAEPIFQSPS